MRLAVRCSILAGLIALAAAPTAGASLHGTIARHSFHSRALARKARYSVYLPPGYAASSTRYPVIYFLHGLPGSSTSYRAIGWFAAALERTRNRAIVIGAPGARGAAPGGGPGARPPAPPPRPDRRRVARPRPRPQLGDRHRARPGGG